MIKFIYRLCALEYRDSKTTDFIVRSVAMIMQQESLESIKEYWICLRALLTEKYITYKVKSRALDLLKSVSEPSSLKFQPDAV